MTAEQSYEVPETEGLTPSEAEQMLREIYSDKRHPCLCQAHPQFEDFRAAITELFEIKDGEQPELAEVKDGY